MRKLVIKGDRGTGKTTMLLLMMKQAVEQGKSCLFVTKYRNKVGLMKKKYEDLGGKLINKAFFSSLLIGECHVDMLFVDEIQMFTKIELTELYCSIVNNDQGVVYESMSEEEDEK